MELKERFNYMVAGYYAIVTLDSYPRRLFLLKDIENYITDYMQGHTQTKEYYLELAEQIRTSTTLREKMQDALILLNDMDGPMDLIITIKTKIKELKYNGE